MLIKSVAALMLLSRIAAAEEVPTVTLARTCVEVTGILDDAGRVAARNRLTRALEERDLFVVENECTETYQVEHSMVGRVLVVRIAGPHGARRWTNPDADKLLPIYRAMVESLLAGGIADPFGPDEPAPVATTTTAPPAPFPVTPYPTPNVGLTPDILILDPKPGGWYFTIGGGALAGASGGVSIGGGYRHRTSRTIVDARLRIQGAGEGGSYGAGVGLYTVTQRDGNTLYAGGGLELSGAVYQTSSVTGTEMTGGGLAPFGTAGVQFGSKTSFRPFAQAELALPLYVARDQTTGESQYPATFSVMLGFTR